MQCDTLFDIASLTKVVATTSLLLLAHHEGVCHLDDACSTSTRRHAGPLSALPPCVNCLHILVASRPGGPCIRRYSLTAPRALRTPALQHAVTGLSKILQEPLAYPPGVQTLYSDLGFILLADIVETRYEQPLDRLFQACSAAPGLAPAIGPWTVRHSCQRPQLCGYRGVSLAGPCWREKCMMRTPGPWVAWPGTPGCLPRPRTCGVLPTRCWKPLLDGVTGYHPRSCGRAGNATSPRPARHGR